MPAPSNPHDSTIRHHTDEDEEDFEEDDDEEEENEEEEHEEGSEDDEAEEEEEEEEEESDEDDEDAIAIKVTRDGDSHTKLVQLSNTVKYSVFKKTIMKRFPDLEQSPYGYLIFYEDPLDGGRVEIDCAKIFRRAIKQYIEGDDTYMRVVVAENARPPSALALGNLNGGLMGAGVGGVGQILTPRAITPRGIGTPRGVSSASQPSTLGAQQPAGRRPSTPSIGFQGSHWSADNVAEASASAAGSELFDILGSETGVNAGTIQWQKMDVLGKGSFGTVFSAITPTGKLMAVKQMELPADKVDGEENQEFQNTMAEINLMKTLKHPAIVAYYGCQLHRLETGVVQFEIFLEHCHGGSLNSLRKKFDREKGRLNIVLLRNYIRQVLKGLEYLHGKGVMHRDIKGDNVLISSTGEAKLADFGCSKKMGTGAFDGQTKQLSQTMVGTPLFMAPEVMNDAGPGYSRPADIWSVGCLIIECLGKKPWTVTGTNLFQVMFHIAQSKEMPSGIPNAYCPPSLHDFFKRCFDRDPATRASAKELLEHEWMTCPDSALEEPQYEDEVRKDLKQVDSFMNA